MGIQVQKGQKVELTKDNAGMNKIKVNMSWNVVSCKDSSQFEIDSEVFLLNSSGKAVRDADCIFYNNPVGRQNFVLHVNKPDSRRVKEQIRIDLAAAPQDIERVALTITIHDGEEKSQSFRDISKISLSIYDEIDGKEILVYEIKENLSDETALVAAEIYRYKGEWKFSAVGNGFNGGLPALCSNFGIMVEGTAQYQKNAFERIKDEIHKAIEPKAAEAKDENPLKIDILKKKARVVLEKKKLIGVTARVALVLDISGSMRYCYKSGTVQNVVERIAAVAFHFEDDESLDMWMFDHRYHRLPAVNKGNYENYIQREILSRYKQGTHNHEIFGANDEPSVMRDVINYYTMESQSKYPVLVVFISDGGISKNSEIKKIMQEASNCPLFWQFVGIGFGNYGILQKLDTMTGRIVDNANFFSLDDISKVTDEELYNRLLNEFPLWLMEAQSKGIF